MDKQKIIVVLGLPGAGKTTLINRFTEMDNNFFHLSGGSCIKMLPESDRDTLRKLDSAEILRNQEKVVIGFNLKKQEILNQHIIFDGHCIVKNGNNITEIPSSIIERLGPHLIILLDEKAEIIIQRRREDSTRPNRETETIEQINQIRERQIKICTNYSIQLKIPLIILSPPNQENFSLTLKQST